MDAEILVKQEASIIRELTKLLHIDKKVLISLFASEDHPLPFPVIYNNEERCGLTKSYLILLKQWVDQEMFNPAPTPPRKLDYDLIKQELLNAEEIVATFDFMKTFPPDYFLG